MPDAKSNTKLTGDTHAPEVESDLPLQEGSEGAVGADGTPSDRGRATELGREDRPGRGIRHGGELKDRDDETSEGDSNTRDSGERPKTGS